MASFRIFRGLMACLLSGGFAGSCSGCGVSGTTLSCSCRNENGGSGETSIDLSMLIRMPFPVLSSSFVLLSSALSLSIALADANH